MNPNLITLFRLLLLFVVVGVDYFGFYRLALIMILLAFFSDILDGYVSRKFNKGSEFGIYFDHFADKIFVHLLFIYYLSSGLVPFVIVGLIIFRDYLALALRQYAVTKNVVIASVYSGKAKMWLQAFYLIILAVSRFYPLPENWILGYGIFVVVWTFFSLGDMFVKNKKILKMIRKEF